MKKLYKEDLWNKILEEVAKKENISISCNPEKRSYLNSIINKAIYNKFGK